MNNRFSVKVMGVQAQSPDLILLDIHMPGMNGYEVCQRLKANPNTQDIPVIFISALNEVFDKVKAFTVGGVDYITKPFQVEEVVARVETHLAVQRLQKSLQYKNDKLAQTNNKLVKANQELKKSNNDLVETLQQLKATQE